MNLDSATAAKPRLSVATAGITVIVLSYNNTADTMACLDSLLADSGGGFDILVVDNGSSDGAPAAIRARHPDLALLELPDNRGWAGGNNVGADYALRQGAHTICLLNNDTIVPAGTIASLAETASRFAPCLVHPAIDYTNPAEGAQLDPSRSSDPLPDAPGIFDLGYAYGACLLMQAAVWRAAGGLDERFFLQMEETDLWLRAKRLGARALCDTRVRIRHAESSSFGGRITPVKTYYIARNTLLLAEKHASGPAEWLRMVRAVQWLAVRHATAAGKGNVMFWLLSADPHARAIREGVFDYIRRRFGRLRETTNLGSAGIHAKMAVGV